MINEPIKNLEPTINAKIETHPPMLIDKEGFENQSGLNASVSTDACVPTNEVKVSAIDTNAPLIVPQDLIRLEIELWRKLCNP